MNRFLFSAVAAIALLTVCQSAEAFHGFRRQRVVVRQQVVVQKVVAVPVVQAVVAQPIYSQAIVQPVYSQQIVQPIYSQQIVTPGCQAFFVR